MNQRALKLLSRLMDESQTRIGLAAIEKVFKFGIPFNSPHKIKMRTISKEQVEMELPFIRANKNHLGTMHACAIATLGEFAAGLVIIRNLEPTKYRVVMTQLNVEYIKHGSSNLVGICKSGQIFTEQLTAELSSTHSSSVEMKTEILNTSDDLIAVVTTTWQLKDWLKVKKH